LQRAVALTVDANRRAQRALAAAQLSFQAGAFDASLGLLSTAETGPADDAFRAQVDLTRGRIAFATGRGNEAARLLLQAARRLGSFEPDLARETYLAAWGAAWAAVEQPGGPELLVQVCRAAQALPPRREARPLDLLLEGLTVLTTEGHAVAAPVLQR